MMPRCRVSELMDDPALDKGDHQRALCDLSKLNRISRAAQILWKPVKSLCNRRGTKHIRLLDVATGSGDILFSLIEIARREGHCLQAFGCDLSPVAIDLANARASQLGVDARFFELDAINNNLPANFDVIITSLFTHHLSEQEVVRLLSNAASSCNELVLVSDLVRSSLNLAMVRAATLLFATSPVVRFDGPASVRNSFTPAELSDLATRAGLTDHRISLHFPCRMLLSWSKR